METDASTLRDLLQRAYRYALALSHDETAAEDLLQEACAAVLQAGGPWNDRYLITCIRSRFTDRWRRSRRSVAIVNGSPEEVSNDVADGGAVQGPLGEAVQLDEALGRLRPEEREALFLHVIAGCTAAQVADLMETSRSGVLSLMQRGRRKLQAMLNPDQSEVCP